MGSRILVCDDEPHIQRAVSIKLAHAGFEVVTASDGLEALEAIRHGRPDLLITDCQMPRMDGFTLVEKLRAAQDTAAIPVFLLTAKGFEFDHEEAKRRWRIGEVIAKPFSPRELVRLVRRALIDQPSQEAKICSQGTTG